MNTKGRPPVIIIGMHRSGTGILSQSLEKLGLFIGYKKEPNKEATFFLRLNEWMFKQANASWDNPYNFNFTNDFFKREIIKILKFHLGSYRRIKYLGLKNFLKYKDIRDLDFPWGWKDPRNTFTLDIWKEIFLSAKILHIYRNPIDVAESLRKRELEIQTRHKRNLKRIIKENLLIGKVNSQNSVRVLDIYEGIKLWQEYVERALFLTEKFKENSFHIRYESFLENPEEILKDVIEFIGLDARGENISIIAANIKPERKYAFKGDEKLKDLYMQIKDSNYLIKKLGY